MEHTIHLSTAVSQIKEIFLENTKQQLIDKITNTKQARSKLFSFKKERCINCRMLDASQLCSLKLLALPSSADMRKAHIFDPENQVCDKFDSR